MIWDALFIMTNDYDWSLSNPGPDNLVVWLEPWAEEFVIPVQSTISMRSADGGDAQGIGPVEWTPDCIVIWANAATIEVYIDDMLQDTASAIVPVPEPLSKGMLTLLFANQPSARLGGAINHADGKASWWRRLQRKLGFA